jgi:hypothetical protein
MKTEFVALTPAGAFALLFAGFLIGEAYARWDAFYLLMALLMLLIARNDARVQSQTGRYKLGWLFWKRTGTDP